MIKFHEPGGARRTQETSGCGGDLLDPDLNGSASNAQAAAPEEVSRAPSYAAPEGGIARDACCLGIVNFNRAIVHRLHTVYTAPAT